MGMFSFSSEAWDVGQLQTVHSSVVTPPCFSRGVIHSCRQLCRCVMFGILGLLRGNINARALDAGGLLVGCCWAHLLSSLAQRTKKDEIF